MHLKRYVRSPLLSDLVRIRDCSTNKFKYQNVCRCRKFAQENMVRKVSGLQLPSYGTTFQITLDK